MEHEIAQQHRALYEFFERTGEVLTGDGHLAEKQRAVESLRAALESHLLGEEDLYFPAIASLRPAHAALIRGLVQAHRRFRELVDEALARIEAGSVSAALEALGRFEAAFLGHERQEESLLRAIDREIARRPPS